MAATNSPWRNRKPRVKRRTTFNRAGTTPLGASLGPLSSRAAELQPSAAAVTSPVDFFGLGAGTTGSQAMTPGAALAQRERDKVEQATRGWRTSAKQAKYRELGMEPPGSTMLRQPADGGGLGGDLPEYIEPGDFQEVLRRSPEAMSRLSPALASVLQDYAEREATEAERQQAQAAIQQISEQPTTGPAAPPDIEGTIGPGFSRRYWASRAAEEEGRIRENFAAQRQAIMNDPTLPAEYRKIAGAQLDMKEARALANARATVKNREEDVQNQLDLAMANAMLQRYRTAAPDLLRRQMGAAELTRGMPTYATDWAGLETYQRQARNDRLASLMGRRGGIGGVGGGGGGGGAGGLPVGDPGWNFGAVPVGSAPVSQQYLGQRRKRTNPIASGAMGMPAKKKPDIFNPDVSTLWSFM